MVDEWSFPPPVEAPRWSRSRWAGRTQCCLSLGEFPDDWIVRGGDCMEDPVNPLQRLLVLDVDPVVGLVIELETPALDQIVRLPDVRELELAEAGEVHLLHHDPVRTHRHARLPILDGSV